MTIVEIINKESGKESKILIININHLLHLDIFLQEKEEFRNAIIVNINAYINQCLYYGICIMVYTRIKYRNTIDFSFVS